MPASWSRPTPSPCRLPLLQVRTAHLVKVLTHLLKFRQTSGREGTGVTPNPAGEGHLASHDGHQRITPTAPHPHSGGRRDYFRQRPLAAGRPPPQRRHAPPYTCVAGRFTLLFAQPLVRIRRMRTDQVTLHPDGRVLVRFNTDPVDMPELVGQIVPQHLARHGGPSYVSRNSGWLIPGGIPRNPKMAENMQSQLVEHGIKPRQSCKAALFQLASEIPAAVLVDLVGFSISTATRWVALASEDGSRYIADRAG